MNGRKILCTLVVAGLLLASLGACAPAATPAPTLTPAPATPTVAPPTPTVAPPTPTPAPAAPKGTLTIAEAEVPQSLDPTISLHIITWIVSFTMFDTLVQVDDNGDIVPSLAESWELVSPTAWKFNLRKGVKFHDGTPFTSASVKATLDHIVDPEVKSGQVSIWALYDHTETPDDYTAIIHTKEPMGTMLGSLTLTCMIPSEPSKPLLEHPIGTGPFKFVEWVKDDRLVVEANPDYWGGAPKLEKIVFRIIPELATRISALETGEVDVVDIVPPEEFARLEKAGIQLIKQPTNFQRFLWLAVDGPLSDVRVRQAINLAIDRQEIIKELLMDEAYEVNGCVPPGVIGYCEMPPLKYDPEEAKGLMKEAGYEEGFDLELKLAEYMSKQKELAEVIAAYLGEIGIRVKVVIQDMALWLEDLLALNWQAELIGTGTVTGDADITLRRLYHSGAKRLPYTNESLDELLVAQVGEVDPDKRQELFCEICEILWEDVPVVYLFGTVQVYGVGPRVKNLVTRPSQFLFFKDVYVEVE